MTTSSGSLRALLLLGLLSSSSGCSTPDAAGEGTGALAADSLARLRAHLPGVPHLVVAPLPARAQLTRPSLLEVTPPTPLAASDCHDGVALLHLGDPTIELLSFAGAWDTWAATYRVRSPAGPRTFLVTLDRSGALSGPAREIPDGARVASFRYEFLLVGPSVAEPFLAVVDTSGRESVRATDVARWPAGLGASARVTMVQGEPSRCAGESRIVVEDESGRSVIAIRGYDLTLERLVVLPSITEGTTSVIGLSTAEIVEIATTDAADDLAIARIYRSAGPEGWQQAASGVLGATRPLAAALSWTGWSVLGANPASTSVTELHFDGSAHAPTVVSLAPPEAGDIASVNGVSLLTAGGRSIATSDGALTHDEALPLDGSLVAHHAAGDLAVLGVGVEGVAMRCYDADTLRAPAP